MAIFGYFLILPFQATQMKSKQGGDKVKSPESKPNNFSTIPLPALADPLTFGSGGMFDGNSLSRLIVSTIAEDNYLKVMMVS